MLEDDQSAQTGAEFYTPPETAIEDGASQNRLLLTANGETAGGEAHLYKGQSPRTLREPSLSNGTATPKSVRFGELPLTNSGYTDEDDEEDEDFAPQDRASDDDDDDDDASSSSGEESDDTSDTSMDEPSDDSGASSSVSESSSSDESSSDSDTSSSTGGTNNNDSESESESESDEDSSSDRDSESEASSAPEVISSKAPPLHTAPGRGKVTTKSRNKRRNLSKKLKNLKEHGILDANATLKDVRVHAKALNGVREPKQPVETYREHAMPGVILASSVVDELNKEAPVDTPAPVASNKRKRGEQQSTDEQETGQPEQDWEADLERRKQLLLQNLESLDQSAQVAEASSQKPAKKRLRPDVSAIGRILKQQTKQPAQKQLKSKPSITFEESPAASNPDFYKTKLNVSAFETYHEGYVLDPPPFPFKQHWDPACKTMYPIDRADKVKNRKKEKYLHSTYTAPHVAPTSTNAEGYEEAITPEESPEETPEVRPSRVSEEKMADAMLLDYGDATNLESDTGAAIESQIRDDVATAAQVTDLPPLPEDMSTLPALSHADIVPGAIIAFKFAMMNPNPEISDFVTGVVQRLGDPIPIRLAARDREKMFNKTDEDEEELSVLGGIDMDVNGQDVIMYMQFDFLYEPKLLKAATA